MSDRCDCKKYEYDGWWECPEPVSADNSELLRQALLEIKELVCGDKNPRWSDDSHVGLHRGMIADIVDITLARAEGGEV